MTARGLPRAGGPVPRSRARHRGLFWLAAVVSTFMLVGGGYLAMTTYLRSSQPSDVATAYFTAVAEGDAPRALSFGPIPAGSRAYLTTDVLRQQLKAGAISNVQVVSVAKHDSTAHVTINYQLRRTDGEQRSITDVVPMIRKDRHWWLAESAIATKVKLLEADGRAALAGTAFPADPVLLFPGALPITFDTPNLALVETPGPSTVQFNASTNTTANLQVVPSAAGLSAAQSAIGDALKSCLSPSSKNVLCPVPVSADVTRRAVPGSLHGTLAGKGASTLEVTLTAASDGVFEVRGVVDVSGAYQSLDYENIASTVSNDAIVLRVSARCYANQVTSITWLAP